MKLFDLDKKLHSLLESILPESRQECIEEWKDTKHTWSRGAKCKVVRVDPNVGAPESLTESAMVLSERGWQPAYTQEQLDKLFSLLSHEQPLTKEQLKEIVEEHYEEWPRGETEGGRKSLFTALVRMYCLMHGEMPDGIMPSASWYEKNTLNMLNYLKNKGYDVDTHIELIKMEADETREMNSKKKTRDEAKQIMANHWKSVNNMWPPQAKQRIIAKRDEIISRIEAGEDVEQVFNSLI